MHKLGKLAVILSVCTALLLVWNVALATSVPHPSPSLPPADFDITEVNPIPMVDYMATEISRPIIYWTLTAPEDPYILYAIATPGMWIPCRENETTFLQQVEEHGGVWKIEYQESYYEIEALWSPSPHPTPNRYRFPETKTLHLIPHTTEHVTSGVILAGLWSPLMIAWKRQQHT